MAKTVKAKAKTTSAKKPSKVTKRVAPKKTKSVSNSQAVFMQSQITKESLYWLIFGVVAILFAMWIYNLDAKVRNLYDQIDSNALSIRSDLEVQIHKERAAKAAQTTQ